MKNLLEVLDKVKGTEYPITDKGRIRQKEQTGLKIELTNALIADLREADIEVLETQKGFILLLENEIEGAIPIEGSLVTKPLDYDFYGLHDEFIEKQNKE